MCASNSRGRVKAAPGGVVGGPTPVVDELKMSVLRKRTPSNQSSCPENPAGGDWGMLHEGGGGGESSTLVMLKL
jgi:hypothetical protein